MVKDDLHNIDFLFVCFCLLIVIYLMNTFIVLT